MASGTAHVLKVGEVVEGKYELVRRIGKGGMAVVWEARSLTLQRSVALKLMHAELAENPKLVERFHREARNAASIAHPCVTYVFDVGWTDDKALPYMAMELLEGQNLAAELRTSGALSVQRAVQIGSRILDALEAAHRLGLVHRDLKPENIFLSRQGTQENVKVLDFGISKVLGADAELDALTKTGTMLGTPAYMPPEQVKSARDVDHRADIYALGTVLYEMLAGRPAFEGESFPEIVYLILSEEPPSLLTRRPGLDTSVVDLVQRAMHKDPSRRWQTAEAMRAALQEVVVDTSPGPPKPTPLAWELPSAEEQVSSAATVAARRAWELQKELAANDQTVAAKKSSPARAAARSGHEHPLASSPAVTPVEPETATAPAPAAVKPKYEVSDAPLIEASPSTSRKHAAARSAAMAAAAPRPTTSTSTSTSTTPRAAEPAYSVPLMRPVDTAVPAMAVPTQVRPAPSGGRALWIGIPIVVLAGIAAAGGALWLRDGGLSAPVTPPPSAPVAATAPLLPPLPTRTTAVDAPCRVHVVVTTPGATLQLEGTTYQGSLDLPATCGARRAIHIEAPGHQPQNVVVQAGPDALRHIDLVPATAPPAPVPATSTPRRTPPRPRAPAGEDDDPPVNLESNPF